MDHAGNDKPSDMNRLQTTRVTIVRRLATLAWVVGLSACMVMPSSGADSWKEEVILQDGSPLIVTRTVERGGRHEFGQIPPIREQSVSFVHPQTGERIVWEDKPTPDIKGANFLPMLVNIDKGVTYLVAYPMGCLAYNKWGRPNPPYVVFRHEGGRWQTTPMTDLPASLNTPNLIFSSPDTTAREIGQSVISAQQIGRLIAAYRAKEFRSIVREPIQYDPQCTAMISNGKGQWLGADWFRDQKDLATCKRVCEQKGFGVETCPCGKYFGGN